MVMRRSVIVLLLALVPLIVAACGSGAGSPSPSPSASASTSVTTPEPSSSPGGPEGVALAYLGALASGDTAAAEAMEDDTLRGAAPASQLGQLWSQIEGQFGAFGAFGRVTTAEAAPYVNATVQATFANAILPLIVTVDADGRVAGLHLGAPVPVGSALPSPSASPAAYVDPNAFTERDVTVGSKPWALPGTLAMPVGAGPFPGIVLLAGSGPNDRDETIGPNAPLRDIALGLASSGIATLRYDKRTRVYGTQLATDASLTVREEVVDDAVAAVDLLRATTSIDPSQVFVVGHSLGGNQAPRVAASAPGRVAGIALLEANSSPMAQLIADQYAYLSSPGGGSDPQAAEQLETIRRQAALALSPSLSPTTPASQLPLGVPAPYWLDLQGYEPVATAAALSIPILIVQGGRDYQVPPSELVGWRSGLAAKRDVTIREYPALNHLMIAGEGPSRPAEYSVPGHVAAEVVADLAAWVLGVNSE